MAKYSSTSQNIPSYVLNNIPLTSKDILGKIPLGSFVHAHMLTTHAHTFMK
jgi:hypothetical protein